MERGWKDAKVIQGLFQIQGDGSVSERSKVPLAAMQPVTFQKGQEFVTTDAEPGDGMYITLNGTTQTFLAGDEPIGEQGSGEAIGELALIREGTRKATVRTMTGVPCANIPKKVSEEIVHSNPKVYGALLELLYTKSTNVIREWECTKSELEVASKIQMGMLPKSFEQYYRLLNTDFDARTKPARMVGDDFHDILQIGETHLCFLIAGVARERLPVCLFMTVARTHIKNYIYLGMLVAEAAKRVNNLLNEDNEEKLFVTVSPCASDLQGNRLTFASAGHNRPTISRGHGPFQLLRYSADSIFGTMEDMTYQEQMTELCPGDSLYLHTDEVTETFSIDEELYMEAKMLEALNRHREAGEQPGLTLDYIYRELEKFSRETEQLGGIAMMYLVR